MMLTLVCSLFGITKGEVKVIVNTSTGVSALDEQMVEDLFLGRKKKMSDGSNAIPVILASGPVHEEFLKSFVNRSSSQFNSHWKKAVFTGQGKPPKKFNSEPELIAYVAETPGAIGYASTEADVSSVTVVTSK